MASKLENEHSSKLLDALTLHKPIPLRPRRRYHYTFGGDSTRNLVGDAGKDIERDIGEINHSNLDSDESISDKVFVVHCNTFVYIGKGVLYLYGSNLCHCKYG